VARTLASALATSGGVVGGDGRVAHFGDSAAELGAALSRCVLADRSDLGRILAEGKDLLDLLHRLSTGDVKGLAPGEGRPTVLTTNKGRIVERLFAHHLGSAGVLLVGSSGSAPSVIAHLDRYTFTEETGLLDVTGAWAQLSLVGPAARDAAAAAGLPVPRPGGSVEAEVAGARVRVLGEDGASLEGLSLALPAERSGDVWSWLTGAVEQAGGRPAGSQALEAWRILRGFPSGGAELTEEHNPLEAGLRDDVSFTKGCYVGQEVVARLNTYDKVSRRLVRLSLPAGAAVPARGTPVLRDDRAVGAITSACLPPGRSAPAALAYVKRDALRKAQPLRVGEAPDAPEAVASEE
jgi:tRNA-modifying protein YgfZ